MTWIGIDGYYTSTSSAFSSVFGPTVAAMRAARKPILISETAASPAVGQPAKIDDLFAGIRLYGLLGFVWFGARGLAPQRPRGHRRVPPGRSGLPPAHAVTGGPGLARLGVRRKPISRQLPNPGTNEPATVPFLYKGNSLGGCGHIGLYRKYGT